jgi:hypothetical protein
MRRSSLALAAVLLASLATAPSALGAATENFAFEHGKTNGRTGPTFSAGGSRPPCTNELPCPYETHEFEIKPGEENGSFKVATTWGGNGMNGDAQDDWDLYVYRVDNPGTDEEEEVEVASSATGGNTGETATLQAGNDGRSSPASTGSTWTTSRSPPRPGLEGLHLLRAVPADQPAPGRRPRGPRHRLGRPAGHARRLDVA